MARTTLRCGVVAARQAAVAHPAARTLVANGHSVRSMCAAVPVSPAELEATITEAAEAVAAAAQDPSQEDAAVEAVAAAREASAVAADLGMGPGDEANLTIESAGSVRAVLSQDGVPVVRVNGVEVDAAWLRKHDDSAPSAADGVTLARADVTADGLLDVAFSDGHTSRLEVAFLVEAGPDAE